eukprot:7809415-Ditylum_brightwellii.AAC.1
MVGVAERPVTARTYQCLQTVPPRQMTMNFKAMSLSVASGSGKQTRSLMSVSPIQMPSCTRTGPLIIT